MSELRALGEEQPVTVEFEYEVSPEYIEDFIDQHGIQPSSRYEIEINLADDVGDAETRRRILRAHVLYLGVEGYPELPEPTDDPGKFLRYIEPWTNRIATAETDSERRASLAVEVFEAAKVEWIAETGSSRLRTAQQRGYKVNRLYTQERAEREFPATWVDTSSVADWNERIDPSEEALRLEQAVIRHARKIDPDLGVRIVWLTEPPRDMSDMLDELGMGFENQEAITISPYLQRYVLILPVNSEYQNTEDPEESE